MRYFTLKLEQLSTLVLYGGDDAQGKNKQELGRFPVKEGRDTFPWFSEGNDANSVFCEKIRDFLLRGGVESGDNITCDWTNSHVTVGPYIHDRSRTLGVCGPRADKYLLITSVGW